MKFLSTQHSALRMLALSLVLLVAVSVSHAQVAYNFQSHDGVSIATAPVALTMDCLAANGYGQWTASSSTTHSHLLTNKLTSSTTSNAQAGVLSSTAFTFSNTTGGGTDVYPTSDVVKCATNLKGQVRYVWINDPTARNEFYIEGFNPGNPGVDISFQSLPSDASIIKGGNATGVIKSLTGTNTLASATAEANPLDRFDVAMDASFIYIVWEQAVSAGGGAFNYTVRAMVVNLSTGATAVGPITVTTATGPGSTGRRPTVSVDVRHSTTVAPFDVSYIDAVPGGTVFWTQFNPSTSTFTAPIGVPTAYTDPCTSSSTNWTNPQHARILTASQAGIGTVNERAIYVIADNSGLNLYFNRIIVAAVQATEYCDGVCNHTRNSSLPVGNGITDLFPVLNDPLWAFANPYDGTNAGNTNPTGSHFTEFHCLYRLDRSSKLTGVPNGVKPLMIIPCSTPGSGFCVSGNDPGTGFLNDPVASTGGPTTGVVQYCGAVNQMGIHVHWLDGTTSGTHFYRRDLRKIDEDIEENTLLTDKCVVGDGSGHGGSTAPVLLSNKTLTLYSDPDATVGNVTYTGSGLLDIDNNKTLNIGSSAQTGGHFVVVGASQVETDATSNTWTIDFEANNSMDFYAIPDIWLFGTGHFILNGSGETLTSTKFGNYVKSGDISKPVTWTIHNTQFETLTTSSTPPANITATDAIFQFEPDPVYPYSGYLTLDGNGSFTKCQFVKYGTSTNDGWSVQVFGKGTWDGTTGTGDGNFDGSYSSAQNYTVSFISCYFKVGLDIEGRNPSSPSAVTVDKGMFEKWAITDLGGMSAWWPISIQNASFDKINNQGILIDEGNPPSGITQNYSILIDQNDFLTYDGGTDGIRIANAPDPNFQTEDPYTGLRTHITATNNVFEWDGTEAAGSVAAAIHFQNVTGNIGYNTIGDAPNSHSATKYQRGIWNESSSSSPHNNTGSLICSNTVYGLTHTSAAGLSTDFHLGYAKKNSVTNCAVGHASGSGDAGHVIFSTYTGNATGYAGSSSSQTDLTGVHHNTDGTPNTDDIAAFNVIKDNSGGSQITFAGTSKAFFGKAWQNSTPPTWTVFGENRIEIGSATSPTLLSSTESINPNLKNIDNNFWGNDNIRPESVSPNGTNWDITAPTDVTANSINYSATSHLSSAPTIPSVSCSDGLIAHPKGSEPQSVSDGDTTGNWCSHLYDYGIVTHGNGMWKQSYDSLRLFLESCPLYPDASDAFSLIGGDVSMWGAGGPGRWPDFLQWLKKVLYLNTVDTLWYCEDVMQMFLGTQLSNAEQEAAAQYIIVNGKCPRLVGAFQDFYNSAAKSRHQHWQDSILHRYGYPSTRGWWDSVKIDTSQNPYDSTNPTLEQANLQILLGPQFAVAGPSVSPAGVASLESIRVSDNPFDALLSVTIVMNKTALVTTELRDILGHAVPLERSKFRLMQPGEQTETFSTSNLPAGTYYLRVSTDGGEAKTVKIVKE